MAGGRVCVCDGLPRRLRALDLELMKQVHTKVNLIPVIAKSDTLTRDELAAFKKRIADDLVAHKVRTFTIPVDATDDAETLAAAKDITVRALFVLVRMLMPLSVSVYAHRWTRASVCEYIYEAGGGGLG
jgi:ribosomal protein L18E